MDTGIELSAVQLVAKLTLVLTIGWLAHFAMFTRNPRWQVWTWRVTTVCVALLLVAAMLPPLYRVPVLPPVENTVHRLADQQPSPFDPQSAHEEERRGFRTIDASVPSTTAAGQADSDVVMSARMKSNESLVAESSDRTQNDLKLEKPLQFASSPPASRAASWPRIGVVVYVVVVVLLLARLIAGLLLARRLNRTAVSAPVWVQGIGRTLFSELRCRAIPIQISDRVRSPVLSGIARPTILLPRSILESPMATSDLRGAIAHETAHAIGGDLVWDLWIAVVNAFVWPHPLAWRVRATHRHACERVSDRMAADALHDVAAYQGVLARIALQVLRPASDVGLAMARRSDVRSRLAEIARCPAVPRLGRRSIVMAIAATVMMCGIGLGTLAMRSREAVAGALRARDDVLPADALAPENETDESAQRTRPESLRFKVVDGDDQPLADAKVGLFMYERAALRVELITDAKGIAIFEYPDGDGVIVNMSAMVQRSGFVPQPVRVGLNMRPEDLPVEKTVRLNRGKIIGGQIVDLDGKPIAGALLTINGLMNNVPTGEDGKWVLDSAPFDLTGLVLQVKHPRFLKGNLPVKDGLEGQYRLDPGLTLSGEVRDQNGKPVSDVQITVGESRMVSSDNPGATDGDGKFVVYGLNSGTTVVTAEAPDFAVQLQKVDLDAQTKPISFELQPGKKTRFKIVNSSNEPLGGVRIAADSWRGYRTLRWDVRTDRNGVATWTGAPADPVKFNVLSQGYAYLRDVVVAAQDEPHVITLPRPLTIQGAVTDSHGERISDFDVEIGRRQVGRDELWWDQGYKTHGRNGQFTASYNEACDQAFLRIRAKGFQAWMSEGIPFQEAVQQISVQLQTDSGAAGVVRSPDGQPAIGARMMLATAARPLRLTSDFRNSPSDSTVQQVEISDDKGHFEFESTDATGMIVAIHDAGFAQVRADEVRTAGGIRLQKWAHVTVDVRRGGEPQSGAVVTITPRVEREHVIQYHRQLFSAVADADGRATFPRVIPGEILVSKSISRAVTRSSMYIHDERSIDMSVAPGESKTVQLGGAGMLIKGRIVVQGDPPAGHRWEQTSAISILRGSTDGQPMERFLCFVEGDGTFRFDDIPLGKYILRGNLTAANDETFCRTTITIGQVAHSFDVTDERGVVDLGDVKGEWSKWLAAGDKAPRFVAPGIDQPRVQLGDFQGRLLLIQFWMASCDISLTQARELGQLHQEQANDKRFQLLSLSSDLTYEEAVTAVKKYQWPWPQGYIRPADSTMIRTRYGVEATPVCFLIDPDGTILYRGNDVAEIGKRVRRRLAELPPAIPDTVRRDTGVVPNKINDDFRATANVALAVAIGNAVERGKSPLIQGPGLILLSEQGTPLRALDGIGISPGSSVTGGPLFQSGGLVQVRPLAVDAARERFYCCDTVNQRLVALDRQGRQLFASPVSDLRAVAVDERTGDIWCLERRNLSASEILVLNPEGREKTRHLIAASSLAYSTQDDAFWIAGRAISKMNRDGKILSSQQRPDGGNTFAAVVANRQRGGGWVIDDCDRAIPESRSRLWKVSSDGQAKVAYRFPRLTVPQSLACVNGQPWIAVAAGDKQNPAKDSHQEIQRFSPDGEALEPVKIPATEISVGPQSGIIWLRTNDRLIRIDQDGRELTTVPLSTPMPSLQILSY